MPVPVLYLQDLMRLDWPDCFVLFVGPDRMESVFVKHAGCISWIRHMRWAKKRKPVLGVLIFRT